MKCTVGCPFMRLEYDVERAVYKAFCKRLIKNTRNGDFVGEFSWGEELDVLCQIPPQEFIRAAEIEIGRIRFLIDNAKQDQEDVLGAEYATAGEDE